VLESRCQAPVFSGRDSAREGPNNNNGASTLYRFFEVGSVWMEWDPRAGRMGPVRSAPKLE